jgi:predicted ATPase
MFSRLTLNNWRQFSQIDIRFHPRLTVLTGANGSGKTTILHLLNRHWGWNLPYVSTPRWDKKGMRKYWTGFWAERDDSGVFYEPDLPRLQIGELTYASGGTSMLSVPSAGEEAFNVEIPNAENVYGVYVPSHRAPYVYQRVESIPTRLDAKQQIFDTYLNEIKARYQGGKGPSPSFRIKAALISLATFGYGNEAVDRNEDAVRTFAGFDRILKTVLPSSLRFRRLRVRVPDLLLETDTGDFSFDAVSGGVATVIDIAWQIYMYSQLHETFVVVIDEPESHLHPALQQQLLGDLLHAFPRCQFIIATHSPFMVTSVAESNVYVLSYRTVNGLERVQSTHLEAVNRAATADDILRDVLGVPNTMPNWAHERLEEILRTFTGRPLTQQAVDELRRDVGALGLQDMFPAVLAKVAGDKK